MRVNPFNPRNPRLSGTIPRLSNSNTNRGRSRQFPVSSARFRETSVHFQNSPRLFHNCPRADVFGSPRSFYGREPPRMSAEVPTSVREHPRSFTGHCHHQTAFENDVLVFSSADVRDIPAIDRAQILSRRSRKCFKFRKWALAR